MSLPILTDTIECSCEVCVSACRKKPGWFLPEEIKPAAELLGLSEKDFFDKYLSVDYYGNTDGFLFVLAPATENSEPGKEYPLEPGGRCIFLDEDNKCQIHAAKPYECKSYDHRGSQSSQDDAKDNHKAVAEAWVPHLWKIKELLGRDPEVIANPLEAMLFFLKALADHAKP